MKVFRSSTNLESGACRENKGMCVESVSGLGGVCGA